MKKALIATCVAGLAFVSAGAAFAQTDTTPKKEEAPMAKDAMGHDKMAKEGMKNDKMKHDGMKAHIKNWPTRPRSTRLQAPPRIASPPDIGCAAWP